VGNNVIRALVEAGQSVRALIREKADLRCLDGLDIERVRGDVRDAQAVRRAVSGTAGVVHAAAYVRIGWAQPDIYRAINVDGTHNVAIAAREAGIRMVHVSSCDALPVGTRRQPVDEETMGELGTRVPYAKSKKWAEEAVLHEVSRGLSAMIVSPAFMLGPWDWKPSSGQMLLAVARGKGLLAPPGWCSLCDVRDVAQGILSALERGESGRRYILGGWTYSYLEVWRIFAEVTGGRRPLCRLGPLAVFIAGRSGDLLGRLTGREPLINSATFSLAKRAKNYSSERARVELGYRIRPTYDTVTDAFHWFRQFGYLE
jgi:dihydroflavonol-4-reductase